MLVRWTRRGWGDGRTGVEGGGREGVERGPVHGGEPPAVPHATPATLVQLQWGGTVVQAAGAGLPQECSCAGAVATLCLLLCVRQRLHSGAESAAPTAAAGERAAEGPVRQVAQPPPPPFRPCTPATRNGCHGSYRPTPSPPPSAPRPPALFLREVNGRRGGRLQRPDSGAAQTATAVCGYAGMRCMDGKHTPAVPWTAAGGRATARPLRASRAGLAGGERVPRKGAAVAVGSGRGGAATRSGRSGGARTTTHPARTAAAAHRADQSAGRYRPVPPVAATGEPAPPGDASRGATPRAQAGLRDAAGAAAAGSQRTATTARAHPLDNGRRAGGGRGISRARTPAVALVPTGWPPPGPGTAIVSAWGGLRQTGSCGTRQILTMRVAAVVKGQAVRRRRPSSPPRLRGSWTRRGRSMHVPSRGTGLGRRRRRQEWSWRWLPRLVFPHSNRKDSRTGGGCRAVDNERSSGDWPRGGAPLLSPPPPPRPPVLYPRHTVSAFSLAASGVPNCRTLLSCWPHWR